METSYDEDLSENPFFQVLRRDYSILFERAVTEGMIICVPRCGSFAKSALVQDDFLRHILVPDRDTCFPQFRALSGKEVKVSNRVLTIEYDISKPCSAHLLFEETFYTDDRSKYSLWCIEHPLEQSISASRDDVPVVTNLREALDFLWTEVFNKDIIKDVTMAMEEFQENHDHMEDEKLEVQRDLIGALYAKNLRMLLQDVRLREKTASNGHFLQTVKIATETYTLHGLRNFLPRSVSARMSQEDASLNKIIKNLDNVELRDLGVRVEIYDAILRAKLELSRLNVYSTVLGKIGCLKKSVRYITEGPALFSSDDILPALIFLVIRTGLPNWIAQLAFMKQFRFSVNLGNEADEASFLITSLEAAVEHVRSGVPKASSNEETQTEVDGKREDISLSNLFSAIRKSDLSLVKGILVREESQESPEYPKLCHPLCTCDSCEKSLASVASVTDMPTIHSRDDRGMTALHIASLCGNVNIVDFLLEHGANANDSDADGTTPLHCAASRGHQNTLLLLLHANADPTISDSRGDTALHVASDHGHEGCVKALLYFTEQMGIFMSKSPVNSYGETPLHHASKWGYTGIVEILMEHGANPTATNRRGQTPLAVAHSSRVSKLLENPPRAISLAFGRAPNSLTPKSVNSNGNQSSHGKKEYDSSSRTRFRKVDRMLAAIAENDLRLACYYLGLEEPAKTVDEIQRLCHPLCNCRDCSAIEDADDKREKNPSLGLNVHNERNETALHVACRYGRTELVQILLDAGANVNSTTTDARTPLHLACIGGWLNIVKLLLDCGDCDVNAIDANGDNCLHIAARNGNSSIVKVLLRYGADTSIRNSRGIGPLEEVEKIHSSDIFVRESLSSIIKTLRRSMTPRNSP